MSLLMAMLMSGVLTALFAGIDSQFLAHWMRAFTHAWPIAFPSILIIAPLVRKIVSTLTGE